MSSSATNKKTTINLCEAAVIWVVAAAAKDKKNDQLLENYF